MRLAAYAAAGIAAVVLATYGLSRLKPAAPSVDRTAVWIDSVKRGPMVREVRGTGLLVPEDARWIPATTVGRVERIRLFPGTAVTPDTVILELSNPQLDQERQDAELKLSAAEAALTNLRMQLQNELLQQQAQTTGIETDYKKSLMQVAVYEQLAAKELVPEITLRQARLDAEQLSARFEIARKQLATQAESIDARLAVQQSQVDQSHAVLRLKQQQVGDLLVRAGLAGVLQVVPVEVGQQVAPGTNLARVADPSRLKAQLRISETQAKDIQPGQVVAIDTRNGIVSGTVVRVAPSVQDGTVTVDVMPRDALPRGARPDLTVDGTIELERLDDVLFVGRPASVQEQAIVGLFKLGSDGRAGRVSVKVGRVSVNSVEVLSGLNVGDQVILSDASAWEGFEEIQLQ
jgi:HlyD family secretion protein